MGEYVLSSGFLGSKIQPVQARHGIDKTPERDATTTCQVDNCMLDISGECDGSGGMRDLDGLGPKQEPWMAPPELALRISSLSQSWRPCHPIVPVMKERVYRGFGTTFPALLLGEHSSPLSLSHFTLCASAQETPLTASNVLASGTWQPMARAELVSVSVRTRSRSAFGFTTS